MCELVQYPENDEPLIQEFIQFILESGDQKKYKDLKKYLEKLQEHGLEMNKRFKSESFKRLEPDLYELRPKDFRILFTKKNEIFYILNGFVKKTNETPEREKEIARKCIKKIQNDKDL